MSSASPALQADSLWQSQWGSLRYNWVSPKYSEILSFTPLRFRVGILFLENGRGYLVSFRIGLLWRVYSLNLYILISINFNRLLWSLEEVCDHKETVEMCSQYCYRQSLGLDFSKNVKVITCLSLVINIQIELCLHFKSFWEACEYFYHWGLMITSNTIMWF